MQVRTLVLVFRPAPGLSDTVVVTVWWLHTSVQPPGVCKQHCANALRRRSDCKYVARGGLSHFILFLFGDLSLVVS